MRIPAVDASNGAPPLAQGMFSGLPGLEPHAILPTVGLNVGRLDAFQAQLLLWDLGGAPGLRSIWDKYYADTHALLFVVDSSQPERCATESEGQARERRWRDRGAGHLCCKQHSSLGSISGSSSVVFVSC